MKQFGIISVGLAAIAALGAYYVFANPRAPSAVAQASTEVPRGSGFDFYVLALSWSPTYCQDSQARSRDVAQCSGTRPYAFVVHGLWPQFNRGYPRSCQTNQTRPSQNQIRAMLDIMPSERLVQNQWEKHGTCSGLSAANYLSVVRAAAAQIAIPEAYARAPDWRRVNAEEIEDAFMRANPTLGGDGIGVEKRGNHLSEVRICLTLDLKSRSCPEIDQGGVTPQTRMSMPPSRR